ncbi:helix-turn-helix transcriptional regulator, partial [[Mycobacterium] nativiensis]
MQPVTAGGGSLTDDDALDDLDQRLTFLRSELYRLRLAAGEPSLRSVAQKTGWSRATVSRIFTCDALPTWAPLEAVVTHLGGDATRFRQLWMACKS